MTEIDHQTQEQQQEQGADVGPKVSVFASKPPVLKLGVCDPLRTEQKYADRIRSLFSQ